jgi:hypothetical protein
MGNSNSTAVVRNAFKASFFAIDNLLASAASATAFSNSAIISGVMG